MFFHAWKREEDLQALVRSDRVVGMYFSSIDWLYRLETRVFLPSGPTMSMLSKVQFLMPSKLFWFRD